MAHEVDMQAPTLGLGKADVVFAVKSNGKTMGALHVSRGAVVWFPVKRANGYKLSWTKFAEMMEAEGRHPSEKR